MSDRTTTTDITFTYPFQLGSVVTPFAPGTYKLVVDEDLIQGLSFPAFKRVATHLEIPSISTPTMARQLLQVTAAEIQGVLALDKGRLAERK